MKKNKVHRKLGVIKISPELLEFIPEDEVSLLFGNFFPTHINRNHPYYIEYYGFSPHFDKSEQGFEIPEYTATIDSKEKSIKFEKV